MSLEWLSCKANSRKTKTATFWRGNPSPGWSLIKAQLTPLWIPNARSRDIFARSSRLRRNYLWCQSYSEATSFMQESTSSTVYFSWRLRGLQVCCVIATSLQYSPKLRYKPRFCTQTKFSSWIPKKYDCPNQSQK